MASWRCWSLVLIATKISDITDSYKCALMLLWCRKTRDQLTFLLWKRQNFKFAWADGTACIVEQLWGGDAHRSVSFDIEKLELHPMEHINKICMKEDDSCVGPSSTLYAPNVFISSLTKARSRNLWLYLRYEFRPVGSVSLSKLYRRVGVWRPFSAVDRWVWRLIEILSEIEAWSKRPCLKMSVWALGNCDGHIYTGLNILHSAD